MFDSPHRCINPLTRDDQGHIWFGIADGDSRFDGESWSRFHEEELNLPDDYILSLAASPDGRIYAGTLNGASVWNGVNWSLIRPTQGQAVFSISIPSDGQTAWFGTETGAGRLEVREVIWTEYPSDAPVKHILFDSSGTLWAATSGAGLTRLDRSTSWTYFRTDNSGIANNNVDWVTEVQPGILWIGTAPSSNVGGAAVRFDGQNWHTYLTNNSGASGAEVTVIAVQNDQVWRGDAYCRD
jgi:ligand-binding sensor domain-containing protein